MEAEIIKIVSNLFNGPKEAVGTVLLKQYFFLNLIKKLGNNWRDWVNNFGLFIS